MYNLIITSCIGHGFDHLVQVLHLPFFQSSGDRIRRFKVSSKYVNVNNMLSFRLRKKKSNEIYS